MPKRKRPAFRAKIPLDLLQRGPIQHAALPDALVERIKNFKAVLIEVEPAPLDETIEDFRRDLHPEREINVWERVAEAYQTALARTPAMSLQDKTKIFADLLLASQTHDPIIAAVDPEMDES